MRSKLNFDVQTKFISCIYIFMYVLTFQFSLNYARLNFELTMQL